MARGACGTQPGMKLSKLKELMNDVRVCGKLYSYSGKGSNGNRAICRRREETYCIETLMQDGKALQANVSF
jgi:hypothetical protein